MTTKPEKVGTGFGILVRNPEGKLLLGKRHEDPTKASSALHGEGTWTFPGGKLHPGETILEGSCRELEEEIGAKISPTDLQIICVNEDILADAHFITFGVALNNYTGVVETREPEEITEWQWFSEDALPEKLFFASKKIYDCATTGNFCLTARA